VLLALFFKRGTIRLGSRQCHSELEMSIVGLTIRSSTVRHIVGQAVVGLVYLGIAAAFAFITFIVWLISLVIW